MDENAERIIEFAKQSGIDQDDLRQAIKNLYYADALLELDDTKAGQFMDCVYLNDGKVLNIEVSLEVINR